jgi:hypothetical protein
MTSEDKDSLMFTLGQIEAKVDTVLSQIEGLERANRDLEYRIRSLEKARALVTGYAAAIGAGAALLIKYLPLPK